MKDNDNEELQDRDDVIGNEALPSEDNNAEEKVDHEHVSPSVNQTPCDEEKEKTEEPLQNEESGDRPVVIIQTRRIRMFPFSQN
jgi:hypothetical protein